LWEVATLELVYKATHSSLRQLIMAIPNPKSPDQILFHLVNKMYLNTGYIFRFKPNKSQSTQEIVMGLLVFLKGIWKHKIDTDKFNKFFTSSAIKRSADAW